MNGRDPIEIRKSELRRMLAVRGRGVSFTVDGKLIFKPINYWRKKSGDFRLPRTAHVDIHSFKKTDTATGLSRIATDEVNLTVQQYEYILEVLRSRINHLYEQPGSRSRITLLEERMFAVDLLCTLDI